MAKGILNIGGGVVSVDASGNFTVETGLIADGSSVFNETGVDVDFRIESDDNANMFFVDGGNDRVGIGIATPASALDVRGTMQVGLDGTGYDVKFFGDTPSAYMLWDESADDLVLAGVAGINVSGTGTITGTLATAAQGTVTSLGTLTELQVDDININGKVLTMAGSSGDPTVFTAGTNGTLSIVTTDAAAAAANIQITADGTVDIDSAGVLTLDSGAAINIEPASG